jgi:hypothetical protein
MNLLRYKGRKSMRESSVVVKFAFAITSVIANIYIRLSERHGLASRLFSDYYWLYHERDGDTI